MAPKYQIVEAKVPAGGIARLHGLVRGQQVESDIAPKISRAFEIWLRKVAQDASRDFPWRRTGKTARGIRGSSRVTGGATLASIRGYFLVDPEVAAHEYGSVIKPKNSRYLAVPILDGLRPDGSPKRLGPRSWSSYKTFVYKSKKTDRLYIAYRPKGSKDMKILYVLIDKVVLKEKRFIRRAFDWRFSELLTAIGRIVHDGMIRAYEDKVNPKHLRSDTFAARSRIQSAINARKMPDPSI